MTLVQYWVLVTATLTTACLRIPPAPQGAPQHPCTQGLPPSSSAPYLGGPARSLGTLLQVQQVFQVDLLRNLALQEQPHHALAS